MYTFGPLIAKNSRSGRLLGGAPVTVTTLDGATLTTVPAPLVTNHEGYLPAFTVDTDRRVILARPRGGDPLPLYAHEGIQDAAEAADIINTGRLSEDALESTIEAEVDKGRWTRGDAPSGTDWNEMRLAEHAGIWRISNSALANTMLNLPPGVGTGTVTVEYLRGGTSSSFVSQYFKAENGTTWYRVNRGLAGWGSWRTRSWERGNAPDGTDWNEYRQDHHAGVWTIPSAPAADTMSNLPPGARGGTLTVEFIRGAGASTYGSQTFKGENEIWFRHQVWSPNGTEFTPWERVFPVSGSGESSPAMDPGPYRRQVLTATARARRGGAIGTAGLGAVALRFDHNLTDFKTKVLPLLRQYHLPWAQAINPANIGTGADLMTWQELQTAALQSGGEVWNHSWDHEDAATEAGIYHQVVDSLEALRVNLPSLPIEGWATPGLGGTQYQGASQLNSLEAIAETYAGRLITAHHAFVSGYMPGMYRSLDPNVQQIGANHVNIDTFTPANVTSIFNNAEIYGYGVALMLHPNRLDTSGYLSTADLESIFADLAARREAGTLMVLSYSGLWLADASSDHRHDFAPRNQTTAPLAAGATRSVMLPWSRYEQFWGSAREVQVALTADTATTVSVEVGGHSTSHAVSAGEREIRRYVTLPADSDANLFVRVTPDAPITLEEVRVLAV